MLLKVTHDDGTTEDVLLVEDFSFFGNILIVKKFGCEPYAMCGVSHARGNHRPSEPGTSGEPSHAASEVRRQTSSLHS